MLSDFDRLVQQRSALKSWWKLKTTICGWGGGPHVLRLDSVTPTMVAFCGQAYAGAKNYHDAPEGFAGAVRKQIDAHSKAIVEATYASEIERLDRLIEQHRAAVLKELAAEGIEPNDN